MLRLEDQEELTQELEEVMVAKVADQEPVVPEVQAEEAQVDIVVPAEMEDITQAAVVLDQAEEAAEAVVLDMVLAEVV
jgi:hypothetical protein